MNSPKQTHPQFDWIKEMPPLRHWEGKEEFQDFDWTKSELLSWLREQPGFWSWAFFELANSKLIAYDREANKWKLGEIPEATEDIIAASNLRWERRKAHWAGNREEYKRLLQDGMSPEGARDEIENSIHFRRNKYKPADLLDLLQDGMMNGDWEKAAKENGMPRSTFYRLKGELLKGNLVFHSKVTGTCFHIANPKTN